MTSEHADTRDVNDPARLAEEAKAQVEKQAAELRAAKVLIEIEPPTRFQP